jgi:dGTPase
MKKWIERRSGWTQHSDDARGPFDADYARVVHSGSFRRLQGKTQILNLGDSDFYRTRLTHSLEVAQIAGSVMRQLEKDCSNHPAHEFLPQLSLIQTAGYCHDLGHPPFGHGGEVALNYCMRSDGGFEGNGQTLRILTRLENFSQNDGADLSRRALLAVLKYPVSYTRACNPDINFRELVSEEASAPFLDALKKRYSCWFGVLPIRLHSETKLVERPPCCSSWYSDTLSK